MDISKTAIIAAVGGYVPETVLSNEHLEEMLDTTDEWITERTGIRERRILHNSGKATSDMAAEAVNDLLVAYDIDRDVIDCLILATATPDFGLAPSASLVCSKAGLKNAWSFDLNGACSGFLYALTVGSSFIECGRYRNVLVIGADKMSSIVNYKDRSTCILFGDGAGAVLLTEGFEGSGISQSLFGTDGTGTPHLLVPAGGSAWPADAETVSLKKHFIHQDGKTVFRQAVKNMSQSAVALMLNNGLTPETVDWVIPHQANRRIIQAVSTETKIPLEKFKINIQKYGNTTSATIPLCLWEFKDDFRKGDHIIMTTFGAGFTWGSTYIKW